MYGITRESMRTFTGGRSKTRRVLQYLHPVAGGIMRLARQLLEAFALALTAGAVMVVFHSFGGFTLRASLLLGVCFAIVALWVHQTYKVATFKPYGVQIFVNLDALREDLGMEKCIKPTDGEEPAHELYNFTAISAALHVHYREYVTRTANELKLTGRSTRTDDEYRSSIAFYGVIRGVFSWEPDYGNPGSIYGFLPEFEFGPGRRGFELVLHVHRQWWSDYTRQLKPKLSELPVSDNGSIVLCVLPYGYIPDHIRRWREPMSLFYPFDKIHRQWKLKLAKHGWSFTGFTDSGEEISSRYLIVRYRPIWPAS